MRGWRSRRPLLLALGLLLACSAPAGPVPAAKAPAASETSPAPAPPTAAPDTPAALTRVPARFAYPNLSLSFLPLIVARDMGHYAEEGLDAELAEMRANVGQAALLSGEVDYTASLGSNVKMALGGAPIKVVFIHAPAPVMALVAQPQLRSPTDLRGKTVGVGVPGATIDQVARLVLKHYGLDPQNDVQVISVGDGAVQYQALQLGQIDSALMSLPFPIAARREGFSILANAADILKFPTTGLGTLQSTLDTRRDEVRRMARSQIRALQFIRSQPDETIRLIGAFFGMDAETARASYEFILPAFSASGTVDRDAMEALLAVEREEGTASGPYTYERVADGGPAEQAARELGVLPDGR
ncbi:MAG TPA: ABC transporter substrate-binding protein [Chloroflexota bacterium]|nr:ABC transporter substrate-binding protein [Chloroflexota bacterium]